MTLRSESIDMAGLTIVCDALEVNGVAMDSTDMSTVADLVGNLTASAAELNIMDGVTATASEINQYCDESAKTEVVSATNVLTAAESGKTMFLSSATEFDTTLPAAALGLNFLFICTAAPVGANYTITAATADTIIGKVISAAGDAGDVENTAGGDVINFVDGQAVAGDRVQVWCDGTYWYALCHASVAAGITITG